MKKKKIIILTLVIGLLSHNISVLADEKINYNGFLEDMVKLSEELSDQNTSIYSDDIKNTTYSDNIKKALSLGLVDLENDIDLKKDVTKQDAINVFYKILIAQDPQYEISIDEADEILNRCYDNALIHDENRIAYASMIRHGIVGTNELTQPDKILTKNSVQFLKDKILNLFKKKLPISINGKEIFVGSSVDEVVNKFGEPDRIDANEFGFFWYVYNSIYSNYCMIGIMDDVVCAYVTNAECFEFDGIKSGDTTNYNSKVDGLIIFRDTEGKVDGVWYNPYSVCDEDIPDCRTIELLDIINSYRSKNNLLTYTLDDTEKKEDTIIPPTTVSDNRETLADNFFEAYLQLLNTGTSNVLNEKSIKTSFLKCDIRQKTGDEDKSTWNIWVEKLPQILLDKKLKPTNEEKDETVEKIEKISMPKIISPAENETCDGDSNVVIGLEKRVANTYLVKIYDKENEAYTVNAYIKTDTDKIVIPSSLFTKGIDYNICVTSVDDYDFTNRIEGETSNFTYGQALTPVSIISPIQKLSTYDSELEFYVTSSAYHDFRIDIYNSKNKIVTTESLKGENVKILKSLPVGKYYVCVTAINHSTGKDVANQFCSVEIKPINPIITETILEPGQVYNYFYGTGLDYVYFYTTETITVEEEVTEEIEIAGEPDEFGNPTAPTKQLVKSIKPVNKTKVIQKKYPATKQYCKLAGITPPRSLTNGVMLSAEDLAKSSNEGLSIASLALIYQGVPYVWGGSSPSGFDCSGLVKYICNKLEISNIARTAAEQFASSGKFVSREQLQPGDFIYFQKDGKIHHVGIYIGNNQMVHAPHTGDIVKVSNLTGTYDYEYAGAKRVY